jgi:hypothetical protein
MGHALRFSGLLHVKANRGRISQFGLKTGGGDGGWCTWHHHGDYVLQFSLPDFLCSSRPVTPA